MVCHGILCEAQACVTSPCMPWQYVGWHGKQVERIYDWNTVGRPYTDHLSPCMWDKEHEEMTNCLNSKLASSPWSEPCWRRDTSTITHPFTITILWALYDWKCWECWKCLNYHHTSQNVWTAWQSYEYTTSGNIFCLEMGKTSICIHVISCGVFCIVFIWVLRPVKIISLILSRVNR